MAKKQPEPEAAPQEKPTQKMIFILELSEATKQFLVGLLADYGSFVKSIPTPEEALKKPAKAKPEPEDGDIPADYEPAPPPPPVKKAKAAKPTEEAPAVSMTQIRELISFKISEGKTVKIKALLEEKKKKNAAALEKDEYGQFYIKLQDL
mgnify:CR=1 FL=1